MIGIYKIENKSNGKLYIGSSCDIARRWTDHVYLLNNNNHHSVHLQRAWNKHGAAAFKFEVLELCDSTMILIREQYYLDTLLFAKTAITNNSKFLVYGYNMKPNAENNIGFKHSEQSINKMLTTKNLQIISVNLITNEILEFLSPKYAALHFNITPAIIRKSIKTKQTCKKLPVGFIKKEDYVYGYKPKLFIPWNKNKHNVTECVNRVCIYVVNINTKEIITFKSILECAKHFNTSSGNISKRLISKPKYYRVQGPYKYLRFFRSLKECNDIV